MNRARGLKKQKRSVVRVDLRGYSDVKIAGLSDENNDAQAAQTQPLAGGELLTAISNKIVAILRQHYGRGPIKAKTYVLDDLVVCVLRNGFTAIEQTMVESGRPTRSCRCAATSR